MSRETFKLDASHSALTFSVRHLMISNVRGSFKDVAADLSFTGTFEAPTLVATAQIASIDTGVADRDQHLRSADFFDAETFPEMRLELSSFSKHGEDFLMMALLTIRGTTKAVSFDVSFGGRGTDPWGNERIAFAAEGEVDRRDFGLVWNQPLASGGVIVGERVKILFEGEFVRAQ